jgi:hypothetical protein
MFHLNLYNINTGKTHYVSAKLVTYVTSIIKIELLVQCTIQISAQFNSAVYGIIKIINDNCNLSFNDPFPESVHLVVLMFRIYTL